MVLLGGMNPNSSSLAAGALAAALTCLDINEEEEEGSLGMGALFASSWTKQRFAALRCHAALASPAAAAAAIYLLTYHY